MERCRREDRVMVGLFTGKKHNIVMIMRGEVGNSDRNGGIRGKIYPS